MKKTKELTTIAGFGIDFTYDSIEDSQPGSVLFVDCQTETSYFNYIEFDILAGRVNLLDEDMQILSSVAIEVKN